MKPNYFIIISGAVLMLLCFSAGQIQADTWYVATNGNDGWAGTSWPTAMATIQAGIDAASDGDTVLVNDGTYVVSSNIVNHKGITVQSVNGADKTVVDGNGAVRCFEISNTCSVLSGFQITGGSVTGISVNNFGGGIRISAGKVSNCIIEKNSGQRAPGIGIVWSDSVMIQQCVIRSNSTSSAVGGFAIRYGRGNFENCLISFNSDAAYIYPEGTGIIQNCTFSGNENGIGGASHGIFKNCVIYNNETYSGDNFSHCCARGLSGNGNITSAPLFVAENDFHLQSNSPCIDAGDFFAPVNLDLDGAQRDRHPDMGAYEYIGAGNLNRNLILEGYDIGTVPSLQIQSVSNRLHSNLFDIFYRLTNAVETSFDVRGFAAAQQSAIGTRKYSDVLYPLTTLLEGTQTNYGVGVIPGPDLKHLVWDAGVDIGHSLENLEIILIAGATSSLPLSLHFIVIPEQGTNPVLKISRYANTGGDEYLLNRAYIWAVLKGWATNNGGSLYAANGTYSSQLIATNSAPSDTGKLWLCEKIGGGVRLATSGEIQHAQEATTPGSVIQWVSYWRPGMKVNAYGIETGQSNAWYFVKE